MNRDVFFSGASFSQFRVLRAIELVPEDRRRHFEFRAKENAARSSPAKVVSAV
ncbi:MAG: hypothetical protein SOX97_08220 [Sutterella sp.]|nr:hypothetical protein [Sutterella sp.]